MIFLIMDKNTCNHCHDHEFFSLLFFSYSRILLTSKEVGINKGGIDNRVHIVDTHPGHYFPVDVPYYSIP